MRVITLFIFCFIYWSPQLSAQEEESDLLSLLGEEETTDYATASFKTNRVINLHSLENTSRGVLDIKISHRFGFLSTGISELFGLDQASIRIGGDYGITDNLQVGIGRSTYLKTIDGYGKYRILRQSSGKKTMPLTMSALASMAITTVPFQNPDRENYFSSRLYYTFQLVMGRKFTEGFTLQVSPTVVHRNLVKTTGEAHDVLSLAAAGRIKINKRLALNFEYAYVLPEQLSPGHQNALSLGFDIETGGHVFQLHFSNSTSMITKGVVTETVGNFFDGDIHFGFNVSRVFTLARGHKKSE